MHGGLGGRHVILASARKADTCRSLELADYFIVSKSTRSQWEALPQIRRSSCLHITSYHITSHHITHTEIELDRALISFILLCSMICYHCRKFFSRLDFQPVYWVCNPNFSHFDCINVDDLIKPVDSVDQILFPYFLLFAPGSQGDSAWSLLSLSHSLQCC